MIGVAIIGHDQSGKSTLATYLMDWQPNSLIVSFGTPLKYDLASIGLDTFTKPYPKAVRTSLRVHAESMMELRGDNYWVDRTFKFLDNPDDNLQMQYEMNIFDDVRHLHEYAALQQRYPKLLTIVLTNHLMVEEDYQYRSVREAQQLIDQSISFTHCIRYNNNMAGSIDDELEQKIGDMLDELYFN